MKEGPITTLEYHFGTVTVYNHYIIAVMNEGITVKPAFNKELIKVAETYFPGKPFGYITHRKNSYSVDPSIYIQTSKIENLVGFAVVSSEEISLSNAQVEKIFLKKPFSIFKERPKAEAWIETLIQKID